MQFNWRKFVFINFGLYFWNIDLIWLGAFLRWRHLTNYKIPRFGPEISIGSIPVFCSSFLVHVVSCAGGRRLVSTFSSITFSRKSVGSAAECLRRGFMFPCFLFRLPGAIPHRETPVIACILAYVKSWEFESLGFHSVDAGFVALVLFDFLLCWRKTFDINVWLHHNLPQSVGSAAEGLRRGFVFSIWFWIDRHP